MIALSTFIRRSPPELVMNLLQQSGLPWPGAPHPSKKSRDIERRLVDWIEQAGEEVRASFRRLADRINAMAGEGGQTALYAVTQNREELDNLPGGYARAEWVFLNHPAAFRHAEEVRYTDEHRRGRMWDGYVAGRGQPLRSDKDAIERFKAAIREHFSSPNVHIDVFERERSSVNGRVFRLTQVTIYREGPLDEHAAFVNGNLAWQPRRTVYEAALTYEEATGLVEVVARDRATRETSVQLFSHELLGAGKNHDRLPLRKFDLSILQKPFNFPTDASDGIKSVEVTLLRLTPVDTEGEKVTLECSRGAANTIWDMAAQRFGNYDPLRSGWLVTQTKLVIHFHPDKSTRGNVLPVTLTMPHGCDLKDRTERERIVGEKYLQRWKLLKDV